MVADIDEAQPLFFAALDKYSPAEWPAFLDGACGGNSELRERVEKLLAAHVAMGSIHGKTPLTGVATIDRIAEQLGTLIGPYKLLEQIGEGGMGVVYMAEQQQPLRRLVALKLVKPGMDTKQVIARFEAERQALAMMDHPNIAKVHDAGTTETGRPYFAMELVRGIPINEFCNQQKLSLRQRLELFIQVCQAVQHAHQKGIIHRDLKPTNVLVTNADTVPLPKVIDFGIAKALGPALTDHTLHTGFAQLVGTPIYMSPEQAQMNHFGVDTRSDVYSLGVLLYELLTGTTPFDKETLSKAGLDELRRMINEDEPPRPSARMSTLKAQALSTISQQRNIDPRRISGTLRGELDWIVMKALEKDRNRRYESASSFAADIQRYLSDEPVLACPPTAMYRFQKFARKHKPVLATAAAIAICLVLGTTVSAWQAARATTAEAQANANEAQAKEAATAEAQQRQRAEANEQKATAQRDEVKALYDQLAAKEQQLQRTLYTAHINLAQRAWDSGAIGHVNELLEKHRPKSGEFDHRGFEWHYLYKLCHPEMLMFQGSAVAYSPDDKRMAIGTNDSLKILDAQTNRELLSINERAKSAAFSPDSKRLAAALRGVEDTVKVWDVQTGKELHAFKGHDKDVWQVAFSSDGKRLASVGDGKRVIVRDSETGQEILAIKGRGHIGSMAFSPDGKRLATAGDGQAIVWDAQTGQELVSLKTLNWPSGGLKGASSVAFSPDGKRLASNSYDVTVQAFMAKIWDAQTGEELLTCKGGKEHAYMVAFSPDGKRLASASFDETVKVWDAQTGDELFSFLAHSRGTNNLAFNPKGTRLAKAGHDGTVRVYDVAAKQEAPTFSGTRFREGNMVAFSPDGKRVTGVTSDPMAREYAIKLWEAKTGQEILSLKQTNRPWVVTISPDGKCLAAGFGTWDETKGQHVACEVKVWDAETGQELLTFKGHTAAVVGLAFSPDSTRVASCSSLPNILSVGNPGAKDPGQPGEVVVWDARSGQELLTLKGHRRFVNSVAFSPDGSRLATLSRDDSVKVWDAQTGRELLSLPVQAEAVSGSVAFSPDGKRLASSNGQTQIKLWNAHTGEELLTLQGRRESRWIGRIAFSPDGSRLASGDGLAGELKLWDAQTGEELLTFDKVGRAGFSFSPDGHRLASAGTEGLKIYDATPLPEKP